MAEEGISSVSAPGAIPLTLLALAGLTLVSIVSGGLVRNSVSELVVLVSYGCQLAVFLEYSFQCFLNFHNVEI